MMLIVCLVVACVSSVHFSIKSMKLEDPELKWKGRFIFIAIICFAVGAGVDSTSETTIVAIRILLIVAGFFFYLGFILPKWAKKIIFRNEEVE